MTIAFNCGQCGQHFELDDSLAGTHGHCKHCGQEMNVPAAGSPTKDFKEAVGEPTAAAAPAPVEKPSSRSSYEDEEDDGKPYEFDKDFVPPPSAVPHYADSGPSLAVMEARAGWRHAVRVFTKKLSKFEDVIYLVLMTFWLIGAVAFLFELKPVVWTMLGLLVICSFLLSLLGGCEIFIKPFAESLRHGLAFILVPPYAIYYIATRWDQMKRPAKKAAGAFGPLLILLALALFSRPIRDWYLHSPPKDENGQAAAAGPVN